jgi:lysophospholipase L1-like esterase
MEKTTLRQRLGLIIFGIILALVCVELLLRAGGLVFLFYRGQLGNNFAQGSQAYRILCLGDSFTQGIGAGKDEDYPSQLQKLLNSLGLPEKFIVINKGIAGQNSSELLADLDINLNIYTPDLVIVLTGMNDGHNTHLHHLALGKNDLFSVFKSWISTLRVYKLMAILCIAEDENYRKRGMFSEKNRKTDGCAAEGEINKLLASKEYEKLTTLLIEKMNQDNIWKYINVAKLTDSPRIIERVINKGIEISPHDDPWLFLTLAKLYQSELRPNRAEGMFEYILRKYPKSSFIRFEFAEFYISQSRFLEARELLLNEVKLHGKSERAQQLLSACDNKDKSIYGRGNQEYIMFPHYITDLNAAKIKKKIRDRGINLIILSYPQGSRLSKEIIQDVFYVDNFQVFSKMPERERESLLSVDNHHCNGNGYKLMAKNVLECMLENVLPMPSDN